GSVYFLAGLSRLPKMVLYLVALGIFPIKLPRIPEFVYWNMEKSQRGNNLFKLIVSGYLFKLLFVPFHLVVMNIVIGKKFIDFPYIRIGIYHGKRSVQR